MLNEAHTTGRRREMPLRALLARMRHNGCGGIAGKAELLTGVDGVSSRPVRRIVLRGGVIAPDTGGAMSLDTSV
jgi:hypothetical protein